MLVGAYSEFDYHRRVRAVLGVLATTLSVGCNGDDTSNMGTPDASVEVDAGMTSTNCWPEDLVRTPQGSAVLGTGRDSYMDMPEVLPLEYGTQDGFNLVAHVRMTGFAPGNPADILDPKNPRTRILSYFVENNVPLNAKARCPFRNGYVDAPGGGYELSEGVAVIFDTCWRSEHLIGKQIRIELELMDQNGGYTTDTKIVTAGAPEGFYPEDMGTPGCPMMP